MEKFINFDEFKRFKLFIMGKTGIALITGLIFLFCGASCRKADDNSPRRLEILFLGHQDNRNHNSQRLADVMLQEYFKEGINISFTTDPDDLNEDNLAHYDGLILYANHDSITPPQEKALLNFVKGGKGFIPLHSASFCFRNSPEVVELIGGQFKSHKYDSFPAVILKPDHPVMNGISSFVTLDETYVHDKISSNIEVLSERVEGDHHEPYTWVRSYGEGRVFYTAYGHDENTFTNPGFLLLVRNGILWAVGEKALERMKAFPIADPKYTDGLVPNYERRDPAPKVQEPLTPEQSMSLTQVPVGFELQLFAAEPDVVKPIYMNWDETGRLWVIETVDYPNEIKDDDIGDDRIKILEDTDGDGKADKFTIFAEGLNIPTSFVFHDGGIIVSMAPSFVFLKDTDGDDKADVRETLLNGWGKRDTHAQASNLRYGLDNKIWGVVGYSGFKGKVGSDSLEFGNGVYRFTPDGSELEFLSRTSNNTWGLGFSEEFDVFISTANNTHSAFLGMPQRYFDKANMTEDGVLKIDAHYGMHVATKNLRQVDVHGGFTSAAGHSLYTARVFPKEYWNRIAFVTEPTGRLIHKNILKQEGSGFIEDGDGWNMLVSADEWAGPIQAEVGPDGALWIADWYNFIIQHNPTPSVASSGVDAVNGPGNAYVNPLRDHERGRIYRLAYKKNDKKNKLRLNKDNSNDLVAALSNDNMFWRTTAQRLLVEKKDGSVFPALYKLVRDHKLDGAGINAPAIHALWTLHGLNAFNGSNQDAIEVALNALRHPSAGVRRAAVQVLPKTEATYDAMASANLFEDPDLRVRLAAVMALTDMQPVPSMGELLADMAGREENVTDMWLRHGLMIASNLNEESFQAAFRARGLDNNPPLIDASLPQRLAYGSRLTSLNVRRTWGRQTSTESPEIAGKEILISGEIERANRPDAAALPPLSGMVITQGDRKNGYGVYMVDDRIYYRINQNGKSYQLQTTDPVPAKFSFKAGLLQDGTMRLVIDDKEAGTTKAPGLFKKELEIPLRVGQDFYKGNDRIAEYPDSVFFLRAGLNNAKLETLGDGKVAVADRHGKVDQVITLNAVKDVMKYDKELITAKAGTTIQIVLNNTDFMQHNLVVIKPNTLEKVGAASNQLAQDPNGAKMAYVPRMPEVLGATPLVNPGESFTLTMTLPTMPGDYIFVCTYPGHWQMMNGVLRVTK